MSRSIKSPPPIIFILFAALAWIGIKSYHQFFAQDTVLNQPIHEVLKSENHTINHNKIANRISWGDKLFFTKSELKTNGAKALQQNNYQKAIDNWQQSLQQFPNDPETVIYINNALIEDRQSYSIVVSAPIGVYASTAQEILRGVAQAQNEINTEGGINGVPLKVAIADDHNDPEIAQELAQIFAKKQGVLGVVGHFSSDVTLAAASVYESSGLVAISPTSTSTSISSAGDFIFRTVPSDRYAGNALANHFLEELNLQNATIFYDSESNYSKSLKESFSTDLIGNGGRVVTEFDLSDPNFDAQDAVFQAKERGTEAFILLATSSTLDSALSVAEINNRELPLLAGDDVYTAKTLKTAGQDTEDMVVAIPWHIRGEVNADFPQASSRLWQAEVNWRTALAYDATQVLIAGLKNNPTRQGIQKTLSASQFSTTGASGEISFLPSGDRNQKPQLVKVQSGNNSGFGYDFVPLD